MRKENAEQTYRSSEETKQGSSDERQQSPPMSRETHSVSHSSTSPSDRKPSSFRTLTSPGQSISGRDTDTGYHNSQSSSYGIQKWLDQTPQEEPWNAAGCSRDFYCKENTNEASNPKTRNANGSKNSSGGK